MKILVYGAGVLGCNLARNLFRAGKDAALLAWGSWAEELQTNGLRIKDTFSPRMSVSRISVVTALKPEAPYDVIFAAVRYTQIASVMDTLRASRAKTIIFVGNNVRAAETAALLPFFIRFRCHFSGERFNQHAAPDTKENLPQDTAAGSLKMKE